MTEKSKCCSADTEKFTGIPMTVNKDESKRACFEEDAWVVEVMEDKNSTRRRFEPNCVSQPTPSPVYAPVMTQAWHKEVERDHVERFLSTSKLGYRIETVRERPDFILTNGRERIGLEHAYAADDHRARSQGIAERYIKNPLSAYLKDHDARGLPAFSVAGNWKENLVRFDIEPEHAQVTLQRLITWVEKSLPVWDRKAPFMIEAEELQVQGLGTLEMLALLHCNAPSFASLSEVNHIAAGFPRATEPGQGNTATVFIEAIIADKEGKLADYRANTRLEQWLLIVTGIGMKTVVLPVQVEGHRFASQFERVYLLDYFEGAAHRLA